MVRKGRFLNLRTALLIAVLVFFVAPFSASAQSCALCYTQAASASARFIQALRSGILVLIIPPLFLSAAITYFAFRKRNQFNLPDDEDGPDAGWH